MSYIFQAPETFDREASGLYYTLYNKASSDIQASFTYFYPKRTDTQGIYKHSGILNINDKQNNLNHLKENIEITTKFRYRTKFIEIHVDNNAIGDIILRNSINGGRTNVNAYKKTSEHVTLAGSTRSRVVYVKGGLKYIKNAKSKTGFKRYVR